MKNGSSSQTSEHPREAISAYLDGELSASERAALEGHLLHCQDCAALVDDLRKISSAAAEEEPPPIPADVAERISRQVGRVVGGSPRPARRRWWLPAAPLAAAATLAGAMVLWILWEQGPPAPPVSQSERLAETREPAPPPKSPSTAPSSEDLSQLRELGYVADMDKESDGFSRRSELAMPDRALDKRAVEKAEERQKAEEPREGARKIEAGPSPPSPREFKKLAVSSEALGRQQIVQETPPDEKETAPREARRGRDWTSDTDEPSKPDAEPSQPQPVHSAPEGGVAGAAGVAGAVASQLAQDEMLQSFAGEPISAEVRTLILQLHQEPGYLISLTEKGRLALRTEGYECSVPAPAPPPSAAGDGSKAEIATDPSGGGLNDRLELASLFSLSAAAGDSGRVPSQERQGLLINEAAPAPWSLTLIAPGKAPLPVPASSELGVRILDFLRERYRDALESRCGPPPHLFDPPE